VREAAAIWSRIAGHELKPHTLREWARSKSWRIEDVRTDHSLGHWAVDRTSLLDSWEAYCHRALAVIEEERKRLRS
jgi:hypothetical protein